MLKGCQKRIVFIKNTECDLFDEAYFILKNDVPYNEMNDDIVRKATAIINQNGFSQAKKKRKKPKKGLLLFLLGWLFSAILSTIIFFII